MKPRNRHGNRTNVNVFIGGRYPTYNRRYQPFASVIRTNGTLRGNQEHGTTKNNARLFYYRGLRQPTITLARNRRTHLILFWISTYHHHSTLQHGTILNARDYGNFNRHFNTNTTFTTRTRRTSTQRRVRHVPHQTRNRNGIQNVSHHSPVEQYAHGKPIKYGLRHFTHRRYATSGLSTLQLRRNTILILYPLIRHGRAIYINNYNSRQRHATRDNGHPNGIINATRIT